MVPGGLGGRERGREGDKGKAKQETRIARRLNHDGIATCFLILVSTRGRVPLGPKGC